MVLAIVFTISLAFVNAQFAINDQSIPQLDRVTATSSTGGGVANGSVMWGNISGTLSNQADLQSALAEKASIVYVDSLWLNATKRIYVFEEFDSGTISTPLALESGFWASSNTGLGCGQQTGGSEDPDSLRPVGHQGILNNLLCNNGRASISKGDYFPVNYTLFETQIDINAIGTATNTYNFTIGLCDNISSDPCTDGVYFKYRFDQINNDLIIGTANANSRTESSVGTYFASPNWEKLRWEYNGTTVSYYRNDNLLGTITTNIPTTSARSSAISYKMIKTSGTAQITNGLDYMLFEVSQLEP